MSNHRSQIFYNGKQLRLGMYDTAHDAQLANQIAHHLKRYLRASCRDYIIIEEVDIFRLMIGLEKVRRKA